MGNAIYKERLKYTYHCYKILWEDIRSLMHRWRITLYLGEIRHEGTERSDWLQYVTLHTPTVGTCLDDKVLG